MKRLFIAILAIVPLLISLTGCCPCGNKTTEKSQNSDDVQLIPNEEAE